MVKQGESVGNDVQEMVKGTLKPRPCNCLQYQHNKTSYYMAVPVCFLFLGMIVDLATPEIPISLIGLFCYISLIMASLTCTGISLGIIFKMTVKSYKIQIQHSLSTKCPTTF